MEKLKKLYAKFDESSGIMWKCMIDPKVMFWLRVAMFVSVLDCILYWTGAGLYRLIDNLGHMALGIMMFRMGEVYGANKQAESDVEFFVGHKYSDEKAEDLTLYD